MELNVSNEAISQLNKIIEEKNAEKNIRVYIAGVGWGGPTFGLALEEPQENDLVQEVGDLKFVFAEDMQQLFTKINIDYGQGFFRRGFTITSNRGGGVC